MDDVMDRLARTDPVTSDPAWPMSDHGRRVMEAALRTEPGVDPAASEPSHRQRVAFYVAAAAAVVVLALAAVALVGADDRADTASEGSAGPSADDVVSRPDDGTPWVDRTPVAPEGFDSTGPTAATGTMYSIGARDEPTMYPDGVRFVGYLFSSDDRWARLQLVEPVPEGALRAALTLHDEWGVPAEGAPFVDPSHAAWERRRLGGLEVETLVAGDGYRVVVWTAPDRSEVRLWGEEGELDDDLVLDVLAGLGAPVRR